MTNHMPLLCGRGWSRRWREDPGNGSVAASIPHPGGVAREPHAITTLPEVARRSQCSWPQDVRTALTPASRRQGAARVRRRARRRAGGVRSEEWCPEERRSLGEPTPRRRRDRPSPSATVGPGATRLRTSKPRPHQPPRGPSQRRGSDERPEQDKDRTRARALHRVSSAMRPDRASRTRMIDSSGVRSAPGKPRRSSTSVDDVNVPLSRERTFLPSY